MTTFPTHNAIRAEGRWRAAIENAIAEAIDLFHMDELSAAMPLKIDVDLKLNVMVVTLYRLLALHIGQGHRNHRARTLFRKQVNAGARINISEDDITVRFGRRANNPFLVANGLVEDQYRISWLGNRRLRFVFGENGA